MAVEIKPVPYWEVDPATLTRDNILEHIARAAKMLEEQSVPPPTYVTVPNWVMEILDGSDNNG